MADDKQNRKRERGANYTEEEKTLLPELVMQYKHIIEDKRTGGYLLSKKKDAWTAITSKYNSNCTTGYRTTEQLKSLYDNMKQKARKIVGESNKIEYKKRKPLTELQVTEEDLARALKNVKEDKVQMGKTGGGSYKPKTSDADTKILAIIKDQVKPHSNQFDSGAIYFKDDINLCEESTEVLRLDSFNDVTICERIESPEPLKVGSSDEVQEVFSLQEIELTENSGDDNLHSNVTLKPSAVIKNKVIETGTMQRNVAHGKKTNSKIATKCRKVSTVPSKLKRNTSAEALKRLYFKKKCVNASLQHKKLMLEIQQMNQEHKMKMLILKKQLDN